MRVLALDTSTWWGSVALVERRGAGPPVVVAELEERVRGSHVEHLLGWIDRVLAQAGWSKASLDAYAATRGPGSFTGVRVGLGTLRGLGLATGKPCYGVTTLESLAEAHGPGRSPRAPMMDAGRGELYTARYDPASSPPDEIETPWLAPAETVLERERSAGSVLIPGPGTEVHAESVVETPRFVASATARVVACRARPGDDPPPLAPLYLRAPDALLKRRRS